MSAWSHVVQGKTPACTSLILENKIPKVVIGSMDPDPRMQGKGLTLLREQGIEVTEKVLHHECDALLSRFKANLKTSVHRAQVGYQL